MHVLLALALVLAPVPTEPAPTDASASEPVEDPAARAARLFGAGEFLEAAEAFEEAFAISGDPALVFGRAQALRRAGNCGAAIDEFERFIALGPPQPDIDEANEVIEACNRVLGIAAGDDPKPPVAAAPTDVPPPPPPKPRRPWHRDPAGIALLTGGITVAALGGGLLGGSYARASDRGGESETEWTSRGRSVRTLSITGIVALSIGAALMLGAAARYGVVARRDRRSPSELASAAVPR